MPDENDEIVEISDESFKSGNRRYNIIVYSVTAILCIILIGGAFLLAINMPGDDKIISAHADSLRNDESYITLETEFESLSYTVNKLRIDAETKKEKVENIKDYDNTKAELRTKIEAKKNELIKLSDEVNKQTSELNNLNSEIDKNSGSILSLPPGTYTVGKNLPVGKYSVTGSGKFMAASKDGESKENSVLGTDAIEITLEKDDIVKIESTCKFTPNG